MTANADAMVRAGVDAYKAGNKDEARTLLERAIEHDSYNETAWLWLSAVVETPEEQQTCLENVLVINPENARAKQGLKSLGVDPDTIINQAAEQDAGDYDEYATPTSSASADYSGSQASTDQYDDWVDGLNISSEDEAQAGGDDLFGDIDFSADGGAFDIDDNIFAEPQEESYEDDGLEPFVDEDLYGDELFDDGDDMFADMGTLENYTDAVGDISDYDDSQFTDDPFASPAAVFDDEPLAEPEPSAMDFFNQIPSEIEPTRPPGVSETVPSFHYAILGVLGLINVGALIFLILQFMG